MEGKELVVLCVYHFRGKLNRLIAVFAKRCLHKRKIPTEENGG